MLRGGRSLELARMPTLSWRSTAKPLASFADVQPLAGLADVRLGLGSDHLNMKTLP